MKNLILLVTLTLLTAGETNISNPVILDSRIQGTWKLDSFYIYENDEVVDTLATTNGYRQIKMYTKDKVMWTRFVPQDSTEWFAYGHYTATDSTLEERLEYGSSSMMKMIDTMRVFSFRLEMEDDRYSQITIDEEGHRFSSENYIRLE